MHRYASARDRLIFQFINLNSENSGLMRIISKCFHDKGNERNIKNADADIHAKEGC